MMFIQKMRKRSHSDRGDAILVMSILFVPFMFLVTGFSMDLTKAVYVKQQYQVMGQEATSAAARNVDSATGSIKYESAQQVVNVYKERFAGVDSSQVNASNGNNYATREGSNEVRSSVCKTVTLEDGSVKTAPYMVITLDGGRNDQDGVNGSANVTRFVSEGGGTATQVSGSTFNPTIRYYSISAEIYDVSPNLILGMFGRSCQQVKSIVSSITFGSQEDVFDFASRRQPVCPASNFRFSGSNTIAWNAVENATSYKLYSKNSLGNVVNTFTTSSTTFNNGAINNLDATKTWYLEAADSAGAVTACGTLRTL